jgi:hypothetical protein
MFNAGKEFSLRIQHLKFRILQRLLIIASLSMPLCLSAQVPQIDSVRGILQGAWRMNADTNVVLIFVGDSMIQRMMRTSGTGRVKFKVTNKNCDTTKFVKENAVYLEETYRYYQYKTAYDGKICNKIVYLQGKLLVLKRDGIMETYTKLKYVPPIR